MFEVDVNPQVWWSTVHGLAVLITNKINANSYVPVNEMTAQLLKLFSGLVLRKKLSVFP